MNTATQPKSHAAPPDAVLLPYQQRWIADGAPVKIIEKSRRVGLSWAEAASCALVASANAGMDCWYIGYNQAMAQEFVRDVAFWAKHFNAAAELLGESVLRDEDKDILTYAIKFASGHRVTALSSRPSNLRGKQGVVVIDEAAFHDDLDGLLKAAMALLIWGGKVRIISTHFGVDNKFNEVIHDCRAGKLPYSVHRITFDEAIAQGLFKRVCLSKGEEWSEAAQHAWVTDIRAQYAHNAAEELDCIPSNSAGAYLSRALIESRMRPGLPVLPLAFDDAFAQLPDDVRYRTLQDWCKAYLDPVLQRLNKHERHFYGMDFGRSGDLSVLMPIAEGALLQKAVPFVVELRNVPFRQQEQLVFYLADRLPQFGGGAHDARGNGQYLAEVAQQRYGAGMHSVMLSRAWYLDNMPRMKAAFEDGELTLPASADILDDLRCLVVDKGVPMIPDVKNTGRDGKQRHGDAAIALCLAIFAVQNAMAPIEFEQIETGRDSRYGDYFGALI